MTRIIQQTVALSAAPDELFDTYLNSKRHGAAVDGTVSISRKEGGRFAVFDGSLTGRNLLIVPKRLIVQTWRAKTWKKSDPDSILILQFSKVAGGGRIDLVHVNVPDHTHRTIALGWLKRYWKPWKTYFEPSLITAAQGCPRNPLDKRVRLDIKIPTGWFNIDQPKPALFMSASAAIAPSLLGTRCSGIATGPGLAAVSLRPGGWARHSVGQRTDHPLHSSPIARSQSNGSPATGPRYTSLRGGAPGTHCSSPCNGCNATRLCNYATNHHE